MVWRLNGSFGFSFCWSLGVFFIGSGFRLGRSV
jgi:hypothetical protein